MYRPHSALGALSRRTILACLATLAQLFGFGGSAFAASALGPAQARAEMNVKVEMSTSEKEEAIPCPSAQKYEDMEACEDKRNKQGYKDLSLEKGNKFVVVSFPAAAERVQIEFHRPEFTLTLGDGKVLEAVATRVQANKSDGRGRVAYPERTRFKANVYSSAYPPMKGEPPFAVVFEVPMSAVSGTLVTPENERQSLLW